jgi:putative membrane protein
MFGAIPPVVVADGYASHHMGEWGWGWVMGGWMMMLLVVAVVVWSMRGAAGLSRNSRSPSPKRILAERFARGEITAEEYEDRRSALQSRIRRR